MGSSSRRDCLIALLALPAAVLVGHGRARAQSGGWTLRNGDVRVRCPLTIGGSFDARTRSLEGTLRGAAAGEPLEGTLIVDLGDLDTGIALRNEHLRNNYLEVGRGPEFARAVMSAVRVSGMDVSAPRGRGTFDAMLALHGVTRAVRGQVEIRRAGQARRVQASFPVVLKEFGIAEPRYLGVGVRDEVTVQVSFETD
jgi:polyisoprenoid-binding protein YceI